MTNNSNDARAAFIRASVWHGSLDAARANLAEHPELAECDIYTAALLGDDAAVCRYLAADRGLAVAKAPPLNWDALTHLCFSRFFRLEPERSDGFIRAAVALLDAGASARTGFFDETHRPEPDFESVLYAAAGVAHHAGMTQLLIDRGADPNEGEVVYHSPETDDNAALRVLVETGQLTPDSLATMLLRKADWHDLEGIRYLLERNADPNFITGWGFTALHQALRRDNSLSIVEAMLDYGASPLLKNRNDHRTGTAIAAGRGRGDVLNLFVQRGITVDLDGVDRLISACAQDDDEAIGLIVKGLPELVGELLAAGGAVLAVFAGNGNTAGAARLLDLGVPVDARFVEGDGYFDVAPNSTALHVAAWRAQHQTVSFLIERRADLDVLDGKGRSALMLAVKACVDSYWMETRAPDSVKALLEAGASAEGIVVPCGYEAVDTLLRDA
ncbi:MAG: ankryin [Armatimonadetes bacterium]|nr:ankryin [Armatimonadota bacterium]MDE2207596.1 ankryin [Armatimonadota bacterium]